MNGNGPVEGPLNGRTRDVPGGPARLRDRFAGVLRRERSEYAQGEERPLGGYTATMAAYAGYVAALTAVGRLTRRRLPARVDPWDLALGTAATFQLSRLLAKDPVTSPLRAPFTRFQGAQGPAELDEDVRGTGARKAVGELITCPFCTGMWVATTFAAGLVLCPKATRIGAAGLTALAGSDVMQFAYSALMGKAEK